MWLRLLKCWAQYYEMGGTIVKGDQRGRTIGFPTANIEPDSNRRCCRQLASTVWKTMLEGQVFRGMMNIGYRPTFTGEPKIVPEVHLFDFNRMVYGSRMRVRFMNRIRGERKFEQR
jgi:riboflavin kinase / FMN adenylyltransferase